MQLKHNLWGGPYACQNAFSPILSFGVVAFPRGILIYTHEFVDLLCYSARYKCGANYVTLAAIPPWSQTGVQPPKAANAAPAAASAKKDDSSDRGMDFEKDKDNEKREETKSEGGMQPVCCPIDCVHTSDILLMCLFNDSLIVFTCQR